MGRRSFKFTPVLHEIKIEDGFVIQVANTDWLRPIKVELKLEQDGMTFYLCRFLENKPEPHQTHLFMRFGVARVSGMDVVEAWPIIDVVGEPEKDARLVETGKANLRCHECPECHQFVNFKTRQRVMGPECVQVTSICPKCGHKDIDVID